jgi:hypothetical protein
VELLGTGTRGGVVEPVWLKLDVPSDFEEWDQPGEYVGEQAVRAALANEHCSMWLPLTIDITTAELGGDSGPTHVIGSLTASEGVITMQASFDLTGCHTQDQSGP